MIHTTPEEDDPPGPVARRLAALPGRFREIAPAPLLSDRRAWDALAAPLRRRLVAAGEAAAELTRDGWPPITARLWLDYSRTGNRARFEAAYFSRRRALNDLILAEGAEGEGRFLDSIRDGIWTLCEESAWQLPAHNAYVRGGPRAPLPDTSRPVIDLFAAETAALLAAAAAVLGPELDDHAPGLAARIDREIDARVIRPYLSEHFWWMGDGAQPTNNWTAWITQNVLFCAFARPADSALRRRIVEKAAGSLDAFLKDYGEDGACEEGAMYWRHAALCLWGALHVLDRAAPGAFGPLWRLPKIRAMAEYLPHLHVDGGLYVNFADCDARLAPCSAREWLFGKAVGSDLLTAFAAIDASRNPAPELPEEWNLWHRLFAIFHSADMAAEMTARTAQPAAPANVFYPSTGLFVARDARFALAVKAGHNGESHNHNDTGSLTLYKDGRPLLIDVGVETYTARTFSPARYDIWTMQSAFHNLPTFGGVMQRSGGAFAARDVTADTAGTPRIVMELAGAWPPEARLRSFRRGVTLHRGHGVAVADVMDGDLPAILSLMFADEPRIAPQGLVLSFARIDVTGGGPIRVEAIPVEDARLRQSWPATLWRALIPVAGSRLDLAIT